MQTHYEDLTQEDPMIGWTWTEAKFENGTIMCTVPPLENGRIQGADHSDGGGMQYNVDVALNGQQFTGRPLQFRYYDIHIEKIDPSIGTS